MAGLSCKATGRLWSNTSLLVSVCLISSTVRVHMGCLGGPGSRCAELPRLWKPLRGASLGERALEGHQQVRLAASPLVGFALAFKEPQRKTSGLSQQEV